MNNVKIQSEFYDVNPPLTPWPDILSCSSLNILYKPREIFFKKSLDSLGILPGSTVLEVGSGQGIFAKRLSDQYTCQVTGVDISAKSVKYAQERYTNKRLKFVKAEAGKLPFRNNFFDFVVSFDTLEHIQDQKTAVAEMVRVLKKGGKILIYTLNKNDNCTLDWFWERLGFDIYKRAAHSRDLFVDPKELERKLSKKFFRKITVKLYGGIFTILLDEILMVKILAVKKIGLFKSKLIGNVVLQTFSVLSKSGYKILNLLDQAWYKKGRSLGFVIIGEKIK